MPTRRVPGRVSLSVSQVAAAAGARGVSGSSHRRRRRRERIIYIHVSSATNNINDIHTRIECVIYTTELLFDQPLDIHMMCKYTFSARIRRQRALKIIFTFFFFNVNSLLVRSRRTRDGAVSD